MALVFLKMLEKLTPAVLLKNYVFKIAQEVTKYLGYFSKDVDLTLRNFKNGHTDGDH